ncbi:hypothetical protein [Veillonella sp.]|uniref:hypothetical protein n=1 Tax=Veillonella sp. TaxID=1926307 RepID=UPI0025F6421C|nr:hypothetical protein [Veillonella sp.]
MHNRHGIIGKSVIESVRRSLQNKYAEDRHIQQLIEELDSTEDLTYEELHITRQAYEEVKARLFYTALLDSLWQEIDETQDLLEQLHIYDSLEDEFQAQGDELTSEELNIDQVDLADVDVSERPVALRQAGTVAARREGAVATRQDGTVVTRQDGSVVNRRDGSVVPRQDGTLVAEPTAAKTQAVAADAITDRDIPQSSLTHSVKADADDNLLAGTNAVLNAGVRTADSAAFAAEVDDDEDDDHNVFPTSEIFLQDILDMLSQNLPDGKEGTMTLEDLMLHTEWKEFKKLAKQAKKSIKKAHKAAKKEAKKVAKEAEKAAKAAEKETKKALKKAKHAKKGVQERSEEWYQNLEELTDDVANTAADKTKEISKTAGSVATAVQSKVNDVKGKVVDEMSTKEELAKNLNQATDGKAEEVVEKSFR